MLLLVWMPAVLPLLVLLLLLLLVPVFPMQAGHERQKSSLQEAQHVV
jgi:hypothetical protein